MRLFLFRNKFHTCEISLKYVKTLALNAAGFDRNGGVGYKMSTNLGFSVDWEC